MKQIKRRIFEIDFVFILILFVSVSNIFSQKLEITPFYGFQFNGKVVGYSGDLNIRDAGAYGLMLDIKVRSGMQVELFYSRSDTRADFSQYRGLSYKLTDLSVNYLQIGMLRTIKQIKNISIYGIGTLGATLLSPSGNSYDETPEKYIYEDWWLFSVTAGGGAKIMFSEKVGLRFEGRLMMPITWQEV